jgi:hypothetical protein
MKPDVSSLESSMNLRDSEIGTSGFSFAGCRANARSTIEIASLTDRSR